MSHLRGDDADYPAEECKMENNGDDIDKETRSLTKGFGLKKWRRFRRKDHVTKEIDADTETEFKMGNEKEKEMGKAKEKDYDSDSTTGRMLKRGSANILNENDASSILPTITIATATPSPFPLSSNHNTTFNVGADSDNSEDTHRYSHSHSHRSSSKSSTAASYPKFPLRASGQAHHSRDKHTHKVNKNVPVNNSNQPHLDPKKKPRGGNLNLDLDKEGSPLSSMESDSRSSFSHFFHASYPQFPIPNSSSLFDTEDACHPLPPAPPSEQQLPATHTGNVGFSPDSSDQLSSSANQGNTKDRQLPTDCDPLVESISMLQSAQLALQTEVQKFKEIGKGLSSFCDGSDKNGDVPVPSTSVDSLVYMDHASDGGSEFTHAYLCKIVHTLERQLNDAKGSLQEKELRISELETTMRNMESPQEHVRSGKEQQYNRCIEMEAELEELFKRKLEVEVLSAVIPRSIKDLSGLVEDQIQLLRKENSLAKEQAYSPRTMVNVENNAVTLQGQAEKSDAIYGGIVCGEEIQKMKRGVVKFTKCLIIQVVLLVIVFKFVWQFAPKSAVVVPT